MSTSDNKTGQLADASRRSFLAAGSAASGAATFGAFAAHGQQQEETKMAKQVAGWAHILDGKVAVVTGAARGIGRAVAVALARSGANIAGIDICATVDPHSGVTPATRRGLDETGALVQTAGVRWRSIVMDQRDLPALRGAAAEIEHEFGAIDI